MKSASGPMFIRCFRNIMCKVKTLFFLGNRIFQGALDVLYILLILLVVSMVVLVLKDYRRQIKQ